ncbi:MAG: alpha-D-ribose 1-methylphosphonate 5-triphosphate diphosphatase [Deltaproteobacteria bacterium]|jgi:alpha-D-ribose 1-methylphosphonate 5-triphosphate diphosphatase|nr:alpha-D-ribose 1-methylphosphonate 5-triphosphate diphosphatase [Deltaproteobacteria bacterium]
MAWIHARAKNYNTKPIVTLSDGLFLTPNGLIKGSLIIQDGTILELVRDITRSGEDLEGDLILPGFVELHTDNLEKNIMPRPGIFWSDPLASLEAHDAQLISAGITTVFDSICVGEPIDKGRAVMLGLSLKAIREGKKSLRADHLVHLRCEISDPAMGELLDQALSLTEVQLISIMDHTPGQRQWRQPEDWLIYHQAKMPPDELMRVSKALKEARDSCAEENTRKVASYARKKGIPLITHDDTEQCHIDDAVSLGARISEFPTTLAAAKGAYDAGLYTVMGTPNLVRGKSHSGNVTAAEVADAGLLTCLSSDYVPISLLHGAYMLFKSHGFSLKEAIDTISLNPSKAANLTNRGSISPGLRADLVRIREIDGRPRIMAVWVKGERVF